MNKLRNLKKNSKHNMDVILLESSLNFSSKLERTLLRSTSIAANVLQLTEVAACKNF